MKVQMAMKNPPKNPKKCEHCEFIDSVYGNIESGKEYWQMTEVFVYLHGTDECNGTANDS